jgi:MoaA/NifB/PqqE/SkfB family radical SAM enzyme
MQTNGTLIDDDWAEFLAERDVLVGISIDGPREIHNAYGVDKVGKPTFHRVMRGLDRLTAHGAAALPSGGNTDEVMAWRRRQDARCARGARGPGTGTLASR